MFRSPTVSHVKTQNRVSKKNLTFLSEKQSNSFRIEQNTILKNESLQNKNPCLNHQFSQFSSWKTQEQEYQKQRQPPQQHYPKQKPKYRNNNFDQSSKFSHSQGKKHFIPRTKYYHQPENSKFEHKRPTERKTTAINDKAQNSNSRSSFRSSQFHNSNPVKENNQDLSNILGETKTTVNATNTTTEKQKSELVRHAGDFTATFRNQVGSKEHKTATRENFESIKRYLVPITLDKTGLSSILLDLYKFHKHDADESFRALASRMDNPLFIVSLIELEINKDLDPSLSWRLFRFSVEKLKSDRQLFDKYARYVYGAILLSLAIRNEFKEMHSILKEISNQSIPPSRGMLCALIFAYGAQGDIKSVKDVKRAIQRKMKEFHRAPSITLASVYAYGINSFFREMKECKNELSGNDSSRIASAFCADLLIDALTSPAMNTVSKIKRVEKVDKPSQCAHIIAPILKAFNELGFSQYVIEIYNSTTHLHYNTAIVPEVMLAYTKTDRLDTAISLYHNTRKHSFSSFKGDDEKSVTQISLGRCFAAAQKPVAAISQYRYALKSGRYSESDILDLFNMDFGSSTQAVQAFNFFELLNRRYKVTERIEDAVLNMLKENGLKEMYRSALTQMNRSNNTETIID
eukprot:gb/GECH01007899.1/.p1 GENE.gb/GECH01007899.1/~~gb/GECH01007899.1/.p1  ORF type:complete len:632 (+),score=136.92 gb/GECH01007899.1/:1-1896(+)